MDSLPTYDNLPWDMIISALQGTLSPDEELQFRQWLAASGDNQQKYDQLRRIWKDRLANYVVYREADAMKALEAVHQRIGDRRIGDRRVMMKRWMAAAAVLFLAAGAGWWYLPGTSPTAAHLFCISRNTVSEI